MSCVLILLMTIGVVVFVLLLEVPLPLLLYSGEVTKKVTESVTT
jgi:hypothetical protein